MSRRLAVLFILCLTLTAAGLAQEPSRIVVLSYNIHHGEGMDGKIDLERIAGVILSVTPDLVSLQEVDRKTQRSGGVDQAAELARLTGMKMAYGRAMDYQGGQYGDAILSRFPFECEGPVSLPHSPEREPRVFLPVEISTPHFFFLATHLDHLRDDHDRMAAVPIIERWAVSKGNIPMLLAGDLNDVPDSLVMKAFRKMWKMAGDGEQLFTIPVDNPQRQIDFILYHPEKEWRVAEVRILDEKIASDHRPIMAWMEKMSSKP
ncbi:MAG: endonuclease/exonuclease/phosphatase family protein [Candidatus Omnitrophota bacterium]